MLEMLLLMVSVGVQSAAAVSGTSGTQEIAVTVPVENPAPIAAAEAVPGEPDPAQSADTEVAESAPAVAMPAFPTAQEPQLVAEPQVPTGKFTTALEVKPILNATRGNWITVREFGGQDLIYVTHLWAWRCGLLELKVGLNGNPPEPWPLPECHLDQPAPGAILESDGLPYRGFNPGSIALIEVQITYDDLSTDRAKFNRQGVHIE